MGALSPEECPWPRLAKLASDDLSDSMKMFKLGVEGEKPEPGQIGVQPEWAYKGDGSWVVAPEQPIELPSYAEDGGEEAEIAGLYVIATNARCCGSASRSEMSTRTMLWSTGITSTSRILS
jgi:hypothetical protein